MGVESAPSGPPASDAAWRREARATLAREQFDLLVIGGGINGAGIARDAALRGLRVAVVERGDFASGTSSRSTKLIHGGLRYLEQGHVRLVLEAVRERERLRRLAPHLVQPLRFVMPLYRGGRVGKLTLRAGLLAYDLLAGLWSVKRHRMLSARRTHDLEPGLRRDGLLGAGEYWDCWTNDARLVLETLLAAVDAGTVAISYAEVTALLVHDGRVCGARVRDRVGGGDEIEVRARAVVNATGPWVDDVRRLDDPEARPHLRLTKGVHVVVPRSRIGHEAAIVMHAVRDGRVMFVIPWGERSLVGTTDTDHVGGAATPPTVERADVAYLLETVNHYFPGAGLGPADVVGAFAGLRPLIAPPAGTVVDASAVSREEEILVSPTGLVSIAGGKLTTYRIIAANVVDRVAAPLGRTRRGAIGRSRTAQRPFPGGTQPPDRVAAALAARDGRALSGAQLMHLAARYGVRAEEVLRVVGRGEELAWPLLPSQPDARAEVVEAVTYEMALTLEDVLRRRTQLELFDVEGAIGAARDVAALMAAELGWTPDAADDAARAYAKARARDVARWR